MEASSYVYEYLKSIGKEDFQKVRAERKEHKICLSAQDGVSVKACLQEIVDRDIYQRDFKSITIPLIFEPVRCDEVKENLQKIIDSGLFE